MKLLFILFSSTTILHAKENFNVNLAADRLMNLFYEDCNAAKKRNFDFKIDGERHGYKIEYNPLTRGKNSKLENRDIAQNFYLINCKNPQNYSCANPATYLWGGKGKIISREKRILDILINENDVEPMAQHPGLDCSGIVNLSFLKAGLKVTNIMDPIDTPFEISAKDFMKPLSCFNTVELEKNKLLKNGDLVAWDKHIFIIDKITNDPFGLKKLNSPEQCDLRKLNPLNANLILLNSKGANDPEENLKLDLVNHSHFLTKIIKETLPKRTGVGPGVVKMHFAQMALSSPIEMMELMQTACLAKFNIQIPSRKVKVVRHKLLENNYTNKDFEECSLKDSEKIIINNDKDLNC